MENKRKGGCQQAQPIGLSATSLATGSPETGTSTLGQCHGLHASSLETSSPEVKPLAKRTHHLESGNSTYVRPRNQRGAGRHPIFTEEQKAEYQSEFEKWWLLQIKQKQNQKHAIEYVRTIIGDIEVGVGTITSQIIRPVLKKLKIKKN